MIDKDINDKLGDDGEKKFATRRNLTWVRAKLRQG